MRKQEIEYILTSILDAFDENISHLNISVGKPFQAERSGNLVGVEIEPPFYELTPFQTEIFALNLIRQDRGLTETLLSEGICSFSYDLPGEVRFATDIFLQRNNYGITLRKKDSVFDTDLEDLDLEDIYPDPKPETGRKGKDLNTDIPGDGDIYAPDHKGRENAFGDETMDEGDETQVFNIKDVFPSKSFQEDDKKSLSSKKKGIGSSFNVFKKLGKLFPGGKSKSKD